MLILLRSFGILLTICCCFFIERSVGQSLNVRGDSIILDMDKISGLGPDGHLSFGIEKNDGIADSISKAFPKVKNIPENLTSIEEYFFILDKFQFFYQNYKSRVYDRSFFLKAVKQNKWNLADTVYLSSRPIICGFSTVVGINSSGEAMYIIDADNNNDMSNDILSPLLKGVRDPDDIVESSVLVTIEYYSEKSVKKDNIRVFIENNGPGIDVSFVFPEFRYRKFTYNNIPYLMCTSIYQSDRANIIVIPDRPYFSSVGRDKRISVGQYVTLDGSVFEFLRALDSGRRILLRGKDTNLFDLSPKLNTAMVPNHLTVNSSMLNRPSSQVGFNAPLIKGINELTGSSIRTDMLNGKYIFVDFWSTTCAPCIAEFKYLTEAYNKYDRTKLEIIGVVDVRGKTSLDQFAKTHKINWPNIQMHVASTDIKGYKVSSYPTTYLIDPNGKIISTNLRRDELLSKLKTLLK